MDVFSREWFLKPKFLVPDRKYVFLREWFFKPKQGVLARMDFLNRSHPTFNLCVNISLTGMGQTAPIRPTDTQ